MEPIVLSVSGEVNARQAAAAAEEELSAAPAVGLLDEQTATDANAAGDDDGADGALKDLCGLATVTTGPSLLADYPAPLTEPQRRAVQRHAAQAVRKYTVVHRSLRTIRRGLESLQRLVTRLRAERDTLSCSASPTDQPAQKAARTDDDASASTSAAPAASSAAPARRVGGLLRSAVFANMQRVLSTAQKEEKERFAEVTQERHRIARETRLQLLSDDLRAQEAVLAPLLEKQQHCGSLDAQTQIDVVAALELLTEMFVQESAYASSFSLRAAPAQAAAASGEAEEAVHRTDTARRTTVVYEVPFCPAYYPPWAEEIIRSQVEDALPAYVAYRARADPVLAKLEEAEAARKAKRVDELLGVLGLSAEQAAAAGAAAAGASDSQRETFISSSLPLSSAAATSDAGQSRAPDGRARRTREVRHVASGFGISDSSDDGDDDEDDGGGDRILGAGMAQDEQQRAQTRVCGASGVDTGAFKRSREDGESEEVPRDESDDAKDRRIIQSALSALDDFDEMF